MSRPIGEEDLHGLADGRLSPERRREVEAWLAGQPQEKVKVEAWRDQNELLRAAYGSTLDAPVPDRLLDATRPPRSTPWRAAAMAACLVLGAVLGYFFRAGEDSRPSSAVASLPHDAAIAHAVYSPEVRHPVEVGADQESHLVGWLSKRLGTSVNAPRLSAQGFELVGGRLLPGKEGPVAQLMYQDQRGRRITLYQRNNAGGNRETAFRYAQEGNVSVFYWIDGRMGYALSGELDRKTLLDLANAVYRQLEPASR